jgi:SEC-C motif-containing protein
MRSRYTAFVLGDSGHLTETWHPSTRPLVLTLDDTVRWSSLEIIEVVGGEPGERRGVVEFRAHWREGADRGILAERSRFVFQRERWWYVDGEVHVDAARE